MSLEVAVDGQSDGNQRLEEEVHGRRTRPDYTVASQGTSDADITA